LINEGETKMEASKQHEHVIRFSVDDEPVETAEHKLTPRAILTLAGIDADNHYLVRIDGRAQHSYQDASDNPIEVHKDEKFISVATGPTPVS
jgi:hypothetical protein